MEKFMKKWAAAMGMLLVFLQGTVVKADVVWSPYEEAVSWVPVIVCVGLLILVTVIVVRFLWKKK